LGRFSEISELTDESFSFMNTSFKYGLESECSIKLIENKDCCGNCYDNKFSASIVLVQ